jgi:hypothetical protein
MKGVHKHALAIEYVIILSYFVTFNLLILVFQTDWGKDELTMILEKRGCCIMFYLCLTVGLAIIGFTIYNIMENKIKT